MKRITVAAAFAAVSIAFIACNNNPQTQSAAKATVATPDSKTNTNAPVKAGVDPKVAANVKEMIGNYLQLKNGLANDNSKDAAAAGKALADDFVKFDLNLLTAGQKKSFQDIADDAKEMAEHIGKSADKLEHQREHFDMLSQDMIDLAKLFGAGQTLFVDHCPMYNNNKGANWLSETKEIKNPYLGKKMLTCGSIKDELK
ncbi:DUF3347 domain-containing protein [Mucilaginibacter defluvii]|uniref:DUF3347 domain-containing protein n=1 Tax=Mucilaginibacter defluvii TaxID=1196019 RepID=A0ABP9FXF8_9SPHI